MKIKLSGPLASMALFILLGASVFIGCKPSLKKDKELTAETKKDLEKPEELSELNIPDTGQVYFKVNVTKNNEPYLNYEGDYPVGSRLDSDFTVQLCASKHILDVSDMVNIDIYIKEIVTGKFPVIVATEQGKATILLTPVKGSSFVPDEGSVTITKYDDKLISGKFEGRGMDYDSNKMSISGVFLNLKYR
jgi:hypothetical protein